MKLEIQDAHFSYAPGIPALRGVNLHIVAGEAVAIVGENGAGKTTLAKHLNGLLKPSAGRVLVGGIDTRESSVAELARHVSFAFQNPDDQLFQRSVRAELAFGPRNLGLSEKEVQERVEEALEQVELAGEGDRHPYDLNVSQRKLVSIAATLAMHSSIVILDEPTAGQDSRLKAQIGAVVERLKAREHTIIIISHDLDFCGEHLERVILMAGGRILGDGPTSEVFADPHLLAKVGIEPPQLVRLSKALGMPGTPHKIEAFVADYASWKGRARTRT